MVAAKISRKVYGSERESVKVEEWKSQVEKKRMNILESECWVTQNPFPVWVSQKLDQFGWVEMIVGKIIFCQKNERHFSYEMKTKEE